MRISCSTKWAASGDAVDAIRLIGNAGFVGVDLMLSSVAAGRYELDVAVEETGLIVSGFVDDRAAPDQWVSAVECAADLGVGSLTLIAGRRKDQQMSDLVEILHAVSAVADSAEIHLELANRLGSRLEQPADFHELFIHLGSHDLGVVVDALEFHLASVNPVDAIAQLAGEMSRLVVGDLVGGRRVPLGEGEVNVAAVLGRARRTGYNSWLVLDPFGGPECAQPDLDGERRRLLTLVEAIGSG